MEKRAKEREEGRWGRKEGGMKGRRTALTDLPYGDRLRPTVEVLLRSALTNAAGGDAGKVNSTKPFQGLPIILPYNPGQIYHTCIRLDFYTTFWASIYLPLQTYVIDLY